jgi:hypothetical protein
LSSRKQLTLTGIEQCQTEKEKDDSQPMNPKEPGMLSTVLVDLQNDLVLAFKF